MKRSWNILSNKQQNLGQTKRHTERETFKKAGFGDEYAILVYGSKLTDEEIELVAVIKKNRLFFSHESDILNALIR